MKMTLFIAVAFSFFGVNYAEARCEIHPDYNRSFRRSMADALYEVRSKEDLAKIIYKLIIIDREVVAHESAHFNTAQGWAEPPVYDTVEIYGKQYRIGGCVQPKLGIPLDIAYRAALAPRRPSRQDIQVAEEIMWRMQVRRRD